MGKVRTMSSAKRKTARKSAVTMMPRTRPGYSVSIGGPGDSGIQSGLIGYLEEGCSATLVTVIVLSGSFSEVESGDSAAMSVVFSGCDSDWGESRSGLVAMAMMLSGSFSEVESGMRGVGSDMMGFGVDNYGEWDFLELRGLGGKHSCVFYCEKHYWLSRFVRGFGGAFLFCLVCLLCGHSEVLVCLLCGWYGSVAVFSVYKILQDPSQVCC